MKKEFYQVMDYLRHRLKKKRTLLTRDSPHFLLETAGRWVRLREPIVKPFIHFKIPLVFVHGKGYLQNSQKFRNDRSHRTLLNLRRASQGCARGAVLHGLVWENWRDCR